MHPSSNRCSEELMVAQVRNQKEQDNSTGDLNNQNGYISQLLKIHALTTIIEYICALPY